MASPMAPTPTYTLTESSAGEPIIKHPPSIPRFAQSMKGMVWPIVPALVNLANGTARVFKDSRMMGKIAIIAKCVTELYLRRIANGAVGIAPNLWHLLDHCITFVNARSCIPLATELFTGEMAESPKYQLEMGEGVSKPNYLKITGKALELIGHVTFLVEWLDRVNIINWASISAKLASNRIFGVVGMVGLVSLRNFCIVASSAIELCDAVLVLFDRGFNTRTMLTIIEDVAKISMVALGTYSAIYFAAIAASMAIIKFLYYSKESQERSALKIGVSFGLTPLVHIEG